MHYSWKKEVDGKEELSILFLLLVLMVLYSSEFWVRNMCSGNWRWKSFIA